MSLFAIFGNPVSHSRSPLLHNRVFGSQNRSFDCYTRVRLEDGERLRATFDALWLKGANITVPFKEVAFAQADRVEGIAKRIGAANTWVRGNDGVIAYNTDAPGFMEAVRGFGPVGRVLVLGAGGTARAVSVALEDAGIDFTVVNRSGGRLGFFRDAGFATATWDALPEGGFDLIVNTTSAGLTDDALPLPEAPLRAYLESGAYAMDAIYGKTTPFLRLAAASGLTYKDGADMLIYQALLAFEHFIGEAVDHSEVYRLMADAMKDPGKESA